MNKIIEKLEKVSDGEECLITFSDGEVMGLKDFEGVDASIYNRDDLIVAYVVSQISGDKKFCKPGSAIEFSVNDIVQINGESVK